ncbi:MAG: GHKL domain-containing protein [Clostridiales bacterium]|nr:GHKL domain-containing protein [Clostridiales bacterium]
MNEILTYIIYYLITITPCNGAAYFPFRNRLRFSKRIAAFTVGAVTVFNCFFIALLCGLGAKYRTVEVITSALYVVFYFIMVKENIFKILFFGIFTSDAIIAARGISLFAIYCLFGSHNEIYILDGLIQSVIFTAVFSLMYAAVRKDIHIIFEEDYPRLWRIIWVVPLLMYVIVFMYTYDISVEAAGRWQFGASRLLLGVCTVLTYGMILKTLKLSRDYAELKERSEAAAHITKIYGERYDLLKTHIEETKIARHNLKQHINLIASYIEKGDKKALEEYVEKYVKLLPKDIKTGFSANYTVDMIVGWYAEKAETKGISFDTDIQVPGEINIPEPMLCVLLGNLIENAIESCQGLKNVKPFIKIRGASPGENTLVFTMDNSCENTFTYKNGRYLSTKHEGEGLGLRSVCDIVNKYDGYAEFKLKDNVFYASVMLNCPVGN